MLYFFLLINELSKYYMVPEKKTVKEITKSIKQEYEKRYKRELSVKQDDLDFLLNSLNSVRALLVGIDDNFNSKR